MSDAASLNVRQQIIIKKILNLHFGHKIVESDKKLAQFDSARGPYPEFSFNHKGGHSEIAWHHTLLGMLQFYFRAIEDETWARVKKIEVCVGGDYGKGAYLLMKVTLFRRHGIIKDPYRAEIKVGEVNEPKDKIEFEINL